MHLLTPQEMCEVGEARRKNQNSKQVGPISVCPV